MPSTVVIDVQTVGLVEAVTGLDRLNANLRDMQSIRNQMDVFLVNLMNDLRAATPVGETGEMQESWDIEESAGNYEFIASIVNNAPHARYVIEGTGVYGPRGSEIVAQGKPFTFFYEGRKFKLWSHHGQPPNLELNQLIDSIPDQTFRVAGRVLRGQVDVVFNRQVTPVMDVEEAADLHTVIQGGWLGA